MAACCCEAASAVMREVPLKRGVADYQRFRSDEQPINCGWEPGREGAEMLIFPQLFQNRGRRFVQQIEEDGIRPPEAADVDRVAGSDAGDGRSRDHIVLFSDRVIAAEIFQNHGEKFLRQAIGVISVSVTAESLNRKKVNGRPAVWEIPLRSGLFHAHRYT